MEQELKKILYANKLYNCNRYRDGLEEMGLKPARRLQSAMDKIVSKAPNTVHSGYFVWDFIKAYDGVSCQIIPALRAIEAFGVRGMGKIADMFKQGVDAWGDEIKTSTVPFQGISGAVAECIKIVKQETDDTVGIFILDSYGIYKKIWVKVVCKPIYTCGNFYEDTNTDVEILYDDGSGEPDMATILTNIEDTYILSAVLLNPNKKEEE